MKERTVEIATPHGAMEAFLCHPDDSGAYPAVILYMDIWGLREELYDIVRRIATAGYYCIVPDLYYRQGKVRFTFRDDQDRAISIDRLDESARENVRTAMRKLTNAMVVEDTGEILKFLGGEPVKRGPKGAIGYCMGGRHVLCVAGAYPDLFKASVSLHGTRLVMDKVDSAHRLADRFQGEMYCGFAEHDPYAPPSTIKTLADLLRDSKTVRYYYEIHPGTVHGYALPDRDIYHKPAANRDWEIIFGMFRRQIPPPASVFPPKPY